MKLKTILNIFVAFSLASSSCDKKNALLVNRRCAIACKSVPSILSTPQQRGKDLIAKITKGLRFKLEGSHTATTTHAHASLSRLLCRIGYNGEPPTEYSMCDSVHNRSCINGQFCRRIDLNSQGRICNDDSCGSNDHSSTSHNPANIGCCILVKVTNAYLYYDAEENAPLPPITVTMLYHDSYDSFLHNNVDFREELTFHSNSSRENDAYIWEQRN